MFEPVRGDTERETKSESDSEFTQGFRFQAIVYFHNLSLLLYMPTKGKKVWRTERERQREKKNVHKRACACVCTALKKLKTED